MSQVASADRRPIYMRLPIPLTRAIKADAAMNGETIQAWVEDAATRKLQRRKAREKTEPTEAE